MINLPIFRAKKLDSDEYVEGGYSDTFFLCMGDIQGHYISYKKINVVGREITLQESIDPTTISIHFPDMLDSKGNKIFASLQEDGKGGDEFLFDNEIFIIWFDNQSLKINATNKDNFECNCHDLFQEWYDFENKCYDLKIIGIQQ